MILYIMFTNFLKNLGIITDDPTKLKHPDLSQGQEFLQYETNVIQQATKRLPFLQMTSMPGLTSINEAFNGDDSLVAANKHIAATLPDSQNEFNKTLTEYATLQQNLDSSALYHNVNASVNDKITQKLAGLNAKLIQQAKKISADISNLHVDNAGLKEAILAQQNYLRTYIQSLEAQYQAGPLTKLLTKGPFDNAHFNTYLMWFVLFITFAALFLYTNFIKNTLSVIISLMLIYILARVINEKYM
jgi:hypothetical protein